MSERAIERGFISDAAIHRSPPPTIHHPPSTIHLHHPPYTIHHTLIYQAEDSNIDAENIDVDDELGMQVDRCYTARLCLSLRLPLRLPLPRFRRCLTIYACAYTCASPLILTYARTASVLLVVLMHTHTWLVHTRSRGGGQNNYVQFLLHNAFQHPTPNDSSRVNALFRTHTIDFRSR